MLPAVTVAVAVACVALRVPPVGGAITTLGVAEYPVPPFVIVKVVTGDVDRVRNLKHWVSAASLLRA